MTTSTTERRISTWRRSPTTCADCARSAPSPTTPTWLQWIRLLSSRLQAGGARVVADGAVLTAGLTSKSSAVVAPHRTLVLGGARSGKSRHAEALLAAEPDVTYVATAAPRPDDAEWAERVTAHRVRRPAHWQTLETGDVADVLLSAAPGQPILVDCLTLWLTRVLDESDAWDGDTSLADKQVERLLDAWRRTEARVVVVSNEVGQGVVPQTASGRLFRDLHGRLNAAVAAASDATAAAAHQTDRRARTPRDAVHVGRRCARAVPSPAVRAVSRGDLRR